MGRISSVILLVGCMMFPTLLSAQFNNNTTSPYSRYGLGDLNTNSFGRTNAMGGAGIASRYNQQINLLNPASYSAIDSLGFMFEFGIDGRFSQFKNDLGSSKTTDINFEYFAMNFQVSNRIGAALGLVPFADVGYNVEVNEEGDDYGQVNTTYYGAGTVSQAFFGLAVEPFKSLSLGANLNYSFGMLNRDAEIRFLNYADFYQVQQYKSIRVSDFGLDFGVQYTIPMKNAQTVIVGITYEHNPKYNAFSSDITKKSLRSGNSIDQDSLYFAEENDGVIELPGFFGVGFSYVKQDKWEINADYQHQAWGDAKFFGEKSRFLTDLNKFALGAEWTPDKSSIRSYLKRVSYRAGIKYEGTYLTFDGQQINDFGISFGFGLPVYRSRSTINVAAEFGKKGTTDNNLVLENYARLNLSVSLYDLWFIQRRFD